MDGDPEVRREFVVSRGYPWRLAWAEFSYRIVPPQGFANALLLVLLVVALLGSLLVGKNDWLPGLIGITVLLALVVLLRSTRYLFVALVARSRYPAGSTLSIDFSTDRFVLRTGDAAVIAEYGQYRKLIRWQRFVGLVPVGVRIATAFYPAELFPPEIRNRFGGAS